MPAFTFERLSPPVKDNPAPVSEPKPRGRVVRMLDRFVERRIQRTLGDPPPHSEGPDEAG